MFGLVLLLQLWMIPASSCQIVTLQSIFPVETFYFSDAIWLTSCTDLYEEATWKELKWHCLHADLLNEPAWLMSIISMIRNDPVCSFWSICSWFLPFSLYFFLQFFRSAWHSCTICPLLRYFFDPLLRQVYISHFCRLFAVIIISVSSFFLSCLTWVVGLIFSCGPFSVFFLVLLVCFRMSISFSGSPFSLWSLICSPKNGYEQKQATAHQTAKSKQAEFFTKRRGKSVSPIKRNVFPFFHVQSSSYIHYIMEWSCSVCSFLQISNYWFSFFFLRYIVSAVLLSIIEA